MISNILQKNIGPFKGLDLRSSNLNVTDKFSTSMLNALYNKSGAITKRNGYQARTNSFGGAGLSTFANNNTTNSTSVNQLVSIDGNLHILNTGILSVTYSGSGDAYINIYFDLVSSTYRLNLVVDQVVLLDYNLTNGIDELSPPSVANVLTQINAITNFTATATGVTSNPAAFLDVLDQERLVIGVASTSTYNYWIIANSPSIAPFAGAQNAKNNTNFINASMVNGKNVLYIGTGYDSLMKYDGQTVYRAGMPQGNLVSTTNLATAGNITNSNTLYIVTYIQKDNKGNIVEGILGTFETGINAAATQISLVISNIIAASGFNTNCAIVNGAQATTNTITVDLGHTINVGDTAYFFDSVSSEYVERLVTALTTTTITINGSPVTVADNAVISNNLRIAIYRNQSAGITYSLVSEIPNNSFSATQTYVDNLADNDLGAEYVVPLKLHGLPPNGRFLQVYRNQLFVAEPLNTIYWSDIENMEYFPPGDNSDNVYTQKGDTITGLGALTNSVFIFKNKGIHIMTGDIASGSYRLDQINQGDIGCESHHSIKEVNAELFFLSKKGIFSIGENAVLIERSFLIEPRFTRSDVPYNFTKAVSINWVQADKYMILLPVESITGGDTHLNTESSTIFTYDYALKAWYEWSNINALGGIAILNETPLFTERRYSTVLADVYNHTYKMLNSGNKTDFIDHNQAISFSYKTHWENMQDPALFKKFLRIKLFSLETDTQLLSDTAFTINVGLEYDYLAAIVGSFTFDFAPNTMGYGLDHYGIDPYGAAKQIQLINKLPTTKCRSMRLTYTNAEPLQPVLISGWEIETAMGYKEFIKDEA